MKKITFSLLPLFLFLGLGFFSAPLAHADVQLDSGQSKSQAPVVFFVGRYARTGSLATAGAHEISDDSVVIWDTTSNDGVSVQTTTTSYDALVAGVTMDFLNGSSRDNTASEDEGYDNWARIQTWGRHASVRFAVCAAPFSCTSGMRVGTAAAAQSAAIFRTISEDVTTAQAFVSSSKDAFGVLLESPAATDTTADIFIKAM